MSHTILSATLLLAAAPAVAAPILSVSPANSTHSPGDLFSIQISITGAVDLISYQFDLGFNPLLVHATTVTFGPFLETGGSTVHTFGAINNVTGLIDSISDVLISGSVNGDGVLATIGFQADAPGTTGLTLSNVILLDANFVGLDPAIQNGAVVVSGAPVPEPAAAIPLTAALFLLWYRRRLG